MKRLIACLLVILAVYGSALTVYAIDAPYYTYTFHPVLGYGRESPHAYLPEYVYDAKNDEAVGGFLNPSSVAVGPYNRMYIADTGKNRIVILNSDFSFEAEITNFYNTDEDREDGFSAPEGVFVSRTGNIYVADTQNARIVLFNPDYTFRMVVREPDSKVLPPGFLYMPSAVVADEAERLYVVAKSTGMGIVEMNLDSEFQGFLGCAKGNRGHVKLVLAFVSHGRTKAPRGSFCPNGIQQYCNR